MLLDFIHKTHSNKKELKKIIFYEKSNEPSIFVDMAGFKKEFDEKINQLINCSRYLNDLRRYSNQSAADLRVEDRFQIKFILGKILKDIESLYNHKSFSGIVSDDITKDKLSVLDTLEIYISLGVTILDEDNECDLSKNINGAVFNYLTLIKIFQDFSNIIIDHTPLKEEELEHQNTEHSHYFDNSEAQNNHSARNENNVPEDLVGAIYLGNNNEDPMPRQASTIFNSYIRHVDSDPNFSLGGNTENSQENCQDGLQESSNDLEDNNFRNN